MIPNLLICKTEEQLADILMNTINEIQIDYLYNKLGLINIYVD